jgi:hypothetical protein
MLLINLIIVLLLFFPHLFLLLFSFSFHRSLLNFFLTEEILTSLHFDIFKSRLLLGREGSIFLLLNCGFLFLLHFNLLEFG